MMLFVMVNSETPCVTVIPNAVTIFMATGASAEQIFTITATAAAVHRARKPILAQYFSGSHHLATISNPFLIASLTGLSAGLLCC